MESHVTKRPLIETSLTARLEQTFHSQLSPHCANFELRALDCYEAYGLRGKSDGVCKDYMDDLKECLFKTKTILRYQAMQKERQRQYKEGLRKEQYAPTPIHEHE